MMAAGGLLPPGLPPNGLGQAKTRRYERAERERQAGIPRRDLAAKLLTIVLQQGPTFIDNLLDED